jgi:hypothetical protein
MYEMDALKRRDMIPFPLFGATGVHGALQHTSRVYRPPACVERDWAPRRPRQGADPRARREERWGAMPAMHKEGGAHNTLFRFAYGDKRSYFKDL